MGEAEPKRFFPAFLDLQGRLVIIVGCGKAAEKRVRQFGRYGADVTLICPRPSELLLAGEAEGAFGIEQRSYVRGDLAGATITICAEDDDEVRRAIFEEAESVGCLVNIAGAPQYSNFLIPGVVRHGRMELAVSTGGAAPEVAKELRKHLDGQLGSEWSEWIDLIVGVRGLVATRVSENPEAAAAAIALVTSSDMRDRIAGGEQLTPELVYAEVVGDDEAETQG